MATDDELIEPQSNSCWVHKGSGLKAMFWQATPGGYHLRIPNMRADYLTVPPRAFHEHWKPWDPAEGVPAPDVTRLVIDELVAQCEHMTKQWSAYAVHYYTDRRRIWELEFLLRKALPVVALPELAAQIRTALGVADDGKARSEAGNASSGS